MYKNKKALFRLDQTIWYVAGFIEVILVLRVILKSLDAYSFHSFTHLFYAVTEPFIAPFYGVLGDSASGSSVIEGSSVLAVIAYLLIAWGLIQFFNLMYSVKPSS